MFLSAQFQNTFYSIYFLKNIKKNNGGSYGKITKEKGHPCTETEALYRPHGP
jgi:hypothetical protein